MSKMNFHDKSIELLAKGFSDEFAKYIVDSDEYNDVLQRLAQKFVEANIPLVKDEDVIELATKLIVTL